MRSGNYSNSNKEEEDGRRPLFFTIRPPGTEVGNPNIDHNDQGIQRVAVRARTRQPPQHPPPRRLPRPPRDGIFRAKFHPQQEQEQQQQQQQQYNSPMTQTTNSSTAVSTLSSSAAAGRFSTSKRRPRNDVQKQRSTVYSSNAIKKSVSSDSETFVNPKAAYNNLSSSPLTESRYDQFTKQQVTPPLNRSTGSFTGLHELCGEASGEDDVEGWKLVLNQLAQNPSAASERQDNLYSWTPMHIACLSKPPSYVVQALISASNQCVAMEDKGGRLPLHLACASGASEIAIRTLVNTLPSSIERVDAKGCVPLHMLLRGSDDTDDNGHISSSLVSLLASRKAARCKVRANGQYPLHYACRKNTSFASKRAILAAYPDALILPDNKGRTPLLMYLLFSFVTGNFPDLKTIELLLGKARSSTSGPTSAASVVPGGSDDDIDSSLDHPLRLLTNNPAAQLAAGMASTETGELPIHVAAQVGASYEVLKLLRDAYPDGIELEDIRGRTALHHLLIRASFEIDERFPSMDAICLLINEQVSRIADVDGKYPLDYLVDAIESHSEIMMTNFWNDDEKCTQSLECLRNFFVSNSDDEFEKYTDEAKIDRFLYLDRIRYFPIKIQNQALLSKYVQSLIRDEMASCSAFALLLLQLYSHLALIWSFRLIIVREINKYTDIELEDEVAPYLFYLSTSLFGAWDVLQIFLLAERSYSKTRVCICFTDMVVLLLLVAGVLLIQLHAGWISSEIETFAIICTVLVWLRLTFWLTAYVHHVALFFEDVIDAVKASFALVLLTSILLLSSGHIIDVGSSPTSCGKNFVCIPSSMSGFEEWNEILFVSMFLIFGFFGLLIISQTLLLQKKNHSREASYVSFWRNRLLHVSCTKYCTRSHDCFGWLVGVHNSGSNLWLFFTDDHVHFTFLEYIAFVFLSLVVVPLWFVGGLATAGISWSPNFKEKVLKAIEGDELNIEKRFDNKLENDTLNKFDVSLSEQKAILRDLQDTLITKRKVG